MKFSSLNHFTIHLASKKNAAKRGEIVMPVRDWFVLLSVGACALLGLIGYGLWVYWQVEHASYDTAVSTSAPGYLRRLESVLADAQKEQAMFESLTAGSSTIPDPSR